MHQRKSPLPQKKYARPHHSSVNLEKGCPSPSLICHSQSQRFTFSLKRSRSLPCSVKHFPQISLHFSILENTREQRPKGDKTKAFCLVLRSSHRPWFVMQNSRLTQLGKTLLHFSCSQQLQCLQVYSPSSVYA